MTIVYTIFVMLALEGLGATLYHWWLHVPRPAPAPALSVPVTDHDADAAIAAAKAAKAAAIDTVVRAVFAEMGLPAEAYHDDFDMVPTGKLYEVLRHAGTRLGIDAELTTVGDVKKWLQD